MQCTPFLPFWREKNPKSSNFDLGFKTVVTLASFGDLSQSEFFFEIKPPFYTATILKIATLGNTWQKIQILKHHLFKATTKVAK